MRQGVGACGNNVLPGPLLALATKGAGACGNNVLPGLERKCSPPHTGDTESGAVPRQQLSAQEGDSTQHRARGESTDGTTSWLVIVVWVAATLPLVAWLSCTGNIAGPSLPSVRNHEGLSRDMRLSRAAKAAGHLLDVVDPLSFMIPQDQWPRCDHGFAVVTPFRADDLGGLPGGVKSLASSGSLEVAGGSLDLIPAPTITDEFMRTVAVAGIGFVESMLERAPCRSILPSGVAEWEPSDEKWHADEVTWYSAAVESSLVRGLNAAASNSAVGAYLLELAARVGADDVPKLEDVPEELRTRSSFKDRRLWNVPFTERFTPTYTEPVPLPQAQEKKEPRSPEEILLPASWDKFNSWVEVESNHLKAIFHAFDNGLPPPPRPSGHGCEVIGQSGFFPEARGVVWDCRARQDGLCQVADFSEPFKSDLDLANIARDLENWPDREMVSMILNGIQYQADIPLQMVMCPHLNDISLDPRAIQKELLRLGSEAGGLGYMEAFNTPPFLPVRLVPQGAVPRKYEAGRPRRKEDGGAPRAELQDEDGVIAPSLNDAIGLKSLIPDDQWEEENEPIFKWPAKEVKPRIGEKMHDDSILGAAAQAGFGPLLQLTDDFADYFNQLGVHPSEYWKVCFLWTFLNAQGESTRWPDLEAFVAEYRLGFGLSLSSGIAQRFSEAIIAVFRERLDKIEEPIMDEILKNKPNSEMAEWIKCRRKLSMTTGKKEDRLYSIKIYTDDPVITAVGHERLIRASEVWRGVISDYKLKAAIARKRQIGTVVIWLGFHFFSILGKTIVPDAKRRRAQERIVKALSPQGLTASEYRIMMGILEHLLVIVRGNRSFMYGMYGHIFTQALRRGANTIVKITENAAGEFLRTQLGRWEERLKTMGSGCSFANSMQEHLNMRDEGVDTFVFGDAAKEGTPTPGLGGYSHGKWWSYRLSGRELTLPIVGLEFIALLFNVIIFGVNKAIEWRSDAQVVAHILQRWAKSSELTQYIHWHLFEPLLKGKLGHRSIFRHINGVANEISDAPSRGKLHILEKWSTQMAMKLEKLEVPESAKNLIQDVVTFFESLPKKVRDQSRLNPQHPTNGVRIGEASNPGPQAYMFEQDRYWAVEPKTAGSGRKAKKGQACSTQPKNHHNQGYGPPTLFLEDREEEGKVSAPRPRPSIRKRYSEQTTEREEVHGTLTKRPRPAKSGALRTQTAKAEEPTNSRGDVSGSTLWDPPAVVYQGLINDTSAFALRPENPQALKDLCCIYAEAMKDANKTKVKTGENAEKAIRNWIAYTQSQGTPPIRSDLAANRGDDPTGYQREVFLCSCFILWTYVTIVPRSKKDPAPKPASALAHLMTVKRWHTTMGISMAKSPHYGKVVTALCRRFIEIHGPEALIPKRKEPIDPSMIRDILRIPSGTKLGKYTIDWNKPFWVSWAAIMTTGMVTGFRKAELVGEFTLGDLSPWNVRWLLKGETRPIARCSNGQLEALKDGDMAIIVPPTSKSDPFGFVFGSTPIHLPVDHNDIANAALRIAKVLLTFPCPAEKWQSVPLFPMDTDFTYIPFKTAEEVLLEVLVRVIGRLEAEKRSMHSLRIGCACSLLAAGASPSQIQALVRWRSEESMKIYARLSSQDYAAWVTKIAAQKIHAISSCNLPTVDAGPYIARALEEADTLDDNTD